MLCYGMLYRLPCCVVKSSQMVACVFHCNVSVVRTPKVPQTGTKSDWIKAFDAGKLCLIYVEC